VYAVTESVGHVRYPIQQLEHTPDDSEMTGCFLVLCFKYMMDSNYMTFFPQQWS